MIMRRITNLPLVLNLESLKDRADVWDFEVTIEIKRAPGTRIAAIVYKLDDGSSRIESVEYDELGVLPEELRDRFIMLVFRLLYHDMMAADGDAMEWHMYDATRWIRTQFGDVDGTRIITALLPYVPDLIPFQSWNCVRID